MTVREAYFELLRAGLWDRPARISGTIAMNEVFRLAQKQSTLQLVIYALQKLEKSGLTASGQLKMQNILLLCANANAATNAVLAKVTSYLREKGIESVLLKGQGAGSYYKQPHLRQCGDIDLYVGEKQYEATIMAMREMLDQKGEYGPKHTAFYYSKDLPIEIHCVTERLHPKKLDRFYQQIADEGTSRNLSSITVNNVTVNTPEDTFNAFYIFHHMWHHTVGMGIGLRQVCDWAMFLHSHSGQLDSERLRIWLRKMHLLNVWKIYGQLAVDVLGIDRQDVPLLDEDLSGKATRLTDFILEEGDNREYKFERGGSGIRKKLGSLAYIFRKTGRMMPIFPGEAFSYLIDNLSSGFRKL